GLELSLLLARPAKGFHELAVLVELEHIVRPVTIGDEDRTVRRDRDGAGVESLRVLVDARFLGKVDRPNLLPIELELDDLVIGRTRAVKIFRPILLAYFQTVNAGRTEGAQELAAGRINHDPSLSVGGDVNVARLVDHHAAVAGAKRLVVGILLEATGREGILQFAGKSHGRYEGDDAQQGLRNAIHGFGPYLFVILMGPRGFKT